MMLQSSKILIVDDMPENVSVLFEFLTKQNFNVFVAENGKRALQVVKMAQVQLILLDILMPEMDGFETCKRLKMETETKDIPVIFITALSDTVSKVKGFKLGAADYITKPFQEEEVLARITTHLNLHQLQQQLICQKQRLYEQNQQLKEITDDLQQRTVELEKRNLELDAFAHTVAHDLKNPLNTVINLTGAFLEKHVDGDLLTQKWRERLTFVEKSGQRSVNIINALLMLAGVSRQMKIKTTPLNMGNLTTKILQNSLSQMVEEYQGKIELPDSWPMAYGYAPWIEEVWINYISNGLKYGGKPPHLRLGATVSEPSEQICFWVQDNGLGLSPEEQVLLFTPFTRLHKGRTEGHGLGLSIVRQIIEKLGGQVGVRSAHHSAGSLFYFTLPT
ncbi:MAG: hybrid sensor histidine kinase/response regulator, partial [Beggiatoa sp. IS2]